MPMADITLGCDTIVVVNPPIPNVVVVPPVPSLVAVDVPESVVTVNNPPELRVKSTPPTSINIVVPVEGPRGPQGPPGGGSGSDFYYLHNQSLPSAGWDVVHGLGKFPNVSVLVSDEKVEVPVLYIDNNTVYIPFATPVTGKAICS